jgi:hypothetical protein
MPAEWEPARVAQLVAALGILAHVCWVRPWNARRTLRTAVGIVEADVHADVTEGYLSARSAGYVDLRSRLAGLRKRPSRAVHLLAEARGAGGAPARASYDVRDCPDEDRPRLAAYAAALDDAVRDYVSTAHPVAWWQLRTGRPVRRFLPDRLTHPRTAPPVPGSPSRAVPGVAGPAAAVPQPRPGATKRRTLPGGRRTGGRIAGQRADGQAAGQVAEGQAAGQRAAGQRSAGQRAGGRRPTVPVRRPATPQVPVVPSVPAPAAAGGPAEIRLPDPSPVDVTRTGEAVGQVVAWPRVDPPGEPAPWGTPQDVVASSPSWASGK